MQEESGRVNKFRLVLFACAALVVIAFGISIALLTSSRSSSLVAQLQSATPLLEQARPLPNFKLFDHRQQIFNETRFAGHWSFVFFGYTHCPDICPLTLSTLNKAMRAIVANDDDTDTQVVFVSVDPKRDNSEQLRRYMQYFNPKFVGISGPEVELTRLTSSIGIAHSKITDPDDVQNYLVDHSASIILIDPQARVYAVFTSPHTAEVLAHDFHYLRRYYEQN